MVFGWRAEETSAGQLLRDVVFDLSVYPAVAASPGVAPGMPGRLLRTGKYFPVL